MAVDHMRSGQTGDFLLGVKSSRRYLWQYPARRQGNDISPAIGNCSGGDPQRVSAARPLQAGVAADDNRRPAPERNIWTVADVLPGSGAHASIHWPPARHHSDERLAAPAPCAVLSRPADTVHKPGGPLRVSKRISPPGPKCALRPSTFGICQGGDRRSNGASQRRASLRRPGLPSPPAYRR